MEEIILYYLLSLIAGFTVQLLLCRKINNTGLRYVPTYLVIIGWIFILLSSLGVFGNLGDSFFDYSFVSLILALYFLPPAVGIVSADIFDFVQKKIKHKKNNV